MEREAQERAIVRSVAKAVEQLFEEEGNTLLLAPPLLLSSQCARALSRTAPMTRVKNRGAKIWEWHRGLLVLVLVLLALLALLFEWAKEASAAAMVNRDSPFPVGA